MTKDTGDISEVPEQMRLDVDGDDGSDASEDGEDTEELEAVYDHPGEVVPEEELQ